MSVEIGSESWNHWPPGNTHGGPEGTGGRGLMPWPKNSPKKHTLEYNNLTVSYDYETKQLKVVSESEEMTFDEEDLVELRAAMTQFHAGLPAGSGVQYR